MYIGSIVYQQTVVTMFNMGFFLNLVLISGTTLYIKIVRGDSLVFTNILLRLAFLQVPGLVVFKSFFILNIIMSKITGMCACWTT